MIEVMCACIESNPDLTETPIVSKIANLCKVIVQLKEYVILIQFNSVMNVEDRCIF